jgi:hypothetical protein
MSVLGKTASQMAVVNALSNKQMGELPRAQQLRLAYTTAVCTIVAVEVC